MYRASPLCRREISVGPARLVVRLRPARKLIGRNIAALVKVPPGKGAGRPSRAMTLAYAMAVMRAAAHTRICAYVVLPVTGIRTEEAGAPAGARRPGGRPRRRAPMRQ